MASQSENMSAQQNEVQQSQVTLSKAADVFMEYSVDVREKLVNDTVSLFLSKPLVRHKDISERLTALNPGSSYARAVPKILIEANEKLKDIFGIEISELGDKNVRTTKGSKANKKTDAKQQKLYILTNQLSAARDEIVDFSDDHANMALTIVVLAYIHIQGGVITGNVLWKHLEQLGVSLSEKKHPEFGDVAKMYKLDDLVKAKWIDRERVMDADGKGEFEYRWGQRALVEIEVHEVIKFLADLCHVDAEPFITEYQRQSRLRLQTEKRLEESAATNSV
eukprot:CFRG3376T1